MKCNQGFCNTFLHSDSESWKNPQKYVSLLFGFEVFDFCHSFRNMLCMKGGCCLDTAFAQTCRNDYRKSHLLIQCVYICLLCPLQIYLSQLSRVLEFLTWSLLIWGERDCGSRPRVGEGTSYSACRCMPCLIVDIII